MKVKQGLPKYPPSLNREKLEVDNRSALYNPCQCQEASATDLKY